MTCEEILRAQAYNLLVICCAFHASMDWNLLQLPFYKCGHDSCLWLGGIRYTLYFKIGSRDMYILFFCILLVFSFNYRLSAYYLCKLKDPDLTRHDVGHDLYHSNVIPILFSFKLILKKKAGDKSMQHFPKHKKLNVAPVCVTLINITGTVSVL